MLYGNNYSKGQYGAQYSDNYLPAVGGDSLLTGLLAWWALEEASGQARVDSHTNGLNLVEGNTTLQASGKIGNAGWFEQPNSRYLRRTSSDAVLNPSGSFTVAAWVYMLALPSGALFYTVASKFDHPSSERGWQLVITGSEKGFFAASADGSTSPSATTTTTMSNTTWYHLLGYYDHDSSQIGVSINNETPVTAAFTGPIFESAAELQIGHRVSDANSYMHGYIDEVACWGRLLTADEKSRLYNSGAGMAYPG
jgi:hypothetical protein